MFHLHFTYSLLINAAFAITVGSLFSNKLTTLIAVFGSFNELEKLEGACFSMVVKLTKISSLRRAFVTVNFLVHCVILLATHVYQ